MADTFKFPNGGYDVTICRKKDILECIDENIIDKDVALAIVEHCEYTAADYIKEGVWAGIPFIGNIRISKTKQLLKSDEQQAHIAELLIPVFRSASIIDGNSAKKLPFKSY